MQRAISRNAGPSTSESDSNPLGPMEATLSCLWVLTPLTATLSLLVVIVAMFTNQWLHTEEKMNNPSYNGTGEKDYLSKLTISGLWSLCFTNQIQFSTSQSCYARKYDFDSIVCVCNETYCDETPPPSPVDFSKFLVYTSNLEGLRFKKTVGNFAKSCGHNLNVINVDRTIKFQQIIGFGGAFTDSTGYNIKKLSTGAQNMLLNAYFSQNGNQYNLCRVPIGGTDFSNRGYTYDDGVPDPQLKNFSLQEEDLTYKIPYIKQAKAIRNDLKLFASAWSPPAWMKTVQELDVFLSFLKRSYYQVWADYHIKFLQAYQQKGLEFWGITTGNEPATGFFEDPKINRLAWTPDLLGVWLANNFGPTMRKNFPQLKIMILDDQRYLIPWAVDFIITNASNKYVDGIGIHWYYDDTFNPELLTETHLEFPDKFLLYTEASILLSIPHVALGLWSRGEKYSHDIIQATLHWATGWVDWNMVLDLGGGPSWESNFLDAPIIVNETSNEFYKQPLYYHFGHFSKFIPEHSDRIFSNMQFSGSDVHVVAFERPDNAVVVVILNRENKVIPITIKDGQNGVAKLGLSRKSITTVIYWSRY